MEEQQQPAEDLFMLHSGTGEDIVPTGLHWLLNLASG